MAISAQESRRLLRSARKDGFLANVILSDRRKRRTSFLSVSPVRSKNEMLHFVQRDRFLLAVIPLPFHGSLEMANQGYARS